MTDSGRCVCNDMYKPYTTTKQNSIRLQSDFFPSRLAFLNELSLFGGPNAGLPGTGDLGNPAPGAGEEGKPETFVFGVGGKYGEPGFEPP